MSTENEPLPLLVKETAAARYLGLSVGALRKWRLVHAGPAYIKISARCVRYRLADLDLWVEEHISAGCAAVRAAGPGVTLIAEERSRQQDRWSLSHDEVEHQDGELADAAIAYLLSSSGDTQEGRTKWPFRNGWKPKDRLADLVRAGALIAAEIDRLDPPGAE